MGTWRAVVARLRARARSRSGRAALAAGAAASVVGFLAIARSDLEAPAPTLLVRDRVGRFLGELADPADERLGFWPVERVPERVAAATLAIEDSRFAFHPGVDPVAVARALWQNLRRGRRVSGASTLAMQVARLQRPGARGYLRKGLEAATAVALTLRHGRDGVLRHYLRIVPYGHRIHGIGYAARRYLDKPVEDLSWAEVAFLTAIPQSPARMDPLDPRGRARALARARRILQRLAERGELAPSELAAALDELGSLRMPWPAVRPVEALHPLLALGERLPPARRARAPIVDTTLDLDLQREAERLAEHAVAGLPGVNAAILVVERGTWRVAAAVGSAGYFDAERAGAIDYLRVPRSSGSTLKPFLFALALERGAISPHAVLDDLGPGPGGIVNSDGRFLGPLLPRIALANSRNVPAAELLERVGADPFYAALGALGLHRYDGPAARYGLGLAIGSLPVTLEGLVGAYTALAGDGTPRTPVWLEGESAAAGERFVSETTARLVTSFLADPQARLPTFPRLGFTEYPFPVAVKTGTSSRYRDAWTVAWSRRYLVGVWVGHPDERPMTGGTGYRLAARLARDLFARLEEERFDGLEGAPFPPPRGYVEQRLCAVTGQRASAACDRVALEWVAADEPLAECTAHRRVAVDRRSGALATTATPPREVETRVLVDLPARYAAWLDSRGGESIDRALRDARRALPGLPETIAIDLLSPEPGVRLLFDPEAPRDRNTLALRAAVAPRLAQLVWYVDGRPVATVEPPYTARWPLVPGEHWIEARAPFAPARSRRVRVVVE